MGSNYYAQMPDGRTFHIGKASAKCRFLFRSYEPHNSPEGYAVDSVPAWKKLLAQDGVSITSDGEVVDRDAFWDLVYWSKEYRYSIPQSVWRDTEHLDDEGWLFTSMDFS